MFIQNYCKAFVKVKYVKLDLSLKKPPKSLKRRLEGGQHRSDAGAGSGPPNLSQAEKSRGDYKWLVTKSSREVGVSGCRGGVVRRAGGEARGPVSVVRLESRRPAGRAAYRHVPRVLVIINFITTKFKKNKSYSDRV